MKKAGDAWLNLRPAETDNMTAEELERLHKLKLELPTAGEEREAAKARIASKRAARVAEQQTLVPDEKTLTDVGEKIGGARKDLSVPTERVRGEKPKDEIAGWRKRYTASQIVKGQRGEEGRWVIRYQRQKDYFCEQKQVGCWDKTFDTKDEAEAAIPLAEVARNHSVGTDGDKYVIRRNITDRKRVQVVARQFESREDAMRYMVEHAVEIIETRTSFGEEILPRPDNVVRRGVKRRDGDVTGDDFLRDFGFRGVEFGNWQAQDERQTVMNHAYDALMDLAVVLGVPSRALGMNGELALAFGARGHGLQGARAHYESDYGVINLTKMKGAGSLAHEWLHALDHYFGRLDGKTSGERVKNERGDLVFKTISTEGFATYGFSKTSAMREELRDAYRNVIDTMMTKAEQFVQDTQKADRFVAEARKDLADKLQGLRNSLSKEAEWGAKKKPANAKQLARFDEITEKMLGGEYAEVEWRRDEKSKSRFGGYRWSNDGLEALSAIYKEVRGRSGWDATNRGGLMDDLSNRVRRYGERVKLLADAQKHPTAEKRVPTSFRTEATRIDQGRASNYWATAHEAAAPSSPTLRTGSPRRAARATS
jgi:hypothetical protein